ncbi:MAG: NfeD family protein [Ruminococcus sp.]|nr:NfeD family protein [Ruminococcus sp.]
MTGIFEYASTNGAVVGWAIAFVVFLIIEGVTLNSLVSIWFAIASLFAMGAAILGFGFVGQLTVFVVYSVVLLVATRALVAKLQSRKGKDPTADQDIGKTATVVESIDNAAGEGRVKLDGTYWAARSADGKNIERGSVVTVRKIDGSKLIVAR